MIRKIQEVTKKRYFQLQLLSEPRSSEYKKSDFGLMQAIAKPSEKVANENLKNKKTTTMTVVQTASRSKKNKQSPC
jgi:hypothetical protein